MWLDIDIGMAFLYFTVAIIWAMIIRINYVAAKRVIKRYQSHRKIDKVVRSIKKDANGVIERLKKEAEENRQKQLDAKGNSKREVHTFQWRKDGVMNEVKIIIDPSLNTAIPGGAEEFKEMVKSGEAGKLEDLLNGIAKPPDRQKMAEVQEFIFSKASVEQMKLVGLSPDDLVAKMLKAAGRMD